MFDQYHLLSLETPVGLRTPNAGEIAGQWFENSLELLGGQKAEAALAGYDDKAVLGSEFNLLGRFEVLLPTLLPEELQDQFLYCQSFTVMHTGRGYYTKRKDYASYLLSYTYAGEGTLRYEGETYVLREGDAFLIDCRNHQEYFTSGDLWQHLDFHIGGPAGVLYDEIRRARPVTFQVLPTERFNRWCEPFLDAYTTVSPNKAVYIHGALTNLLIRILRTVERQSGLAVPNEFQALIRDMEQHYMEPLTLDELASRVNLSKYHFSREFKKYTGVAPHEYLIFLRIQNACLLLQGSPLSVAQVGEAVGIPNQTNFTKLFRSRMGMTPGQFRRNGNSPV